MIHLFRKQDQAFALDVGSGAIHQMDDMAYALLHEVKEEELRSGQFPHRLPTALPGYPAGDLADVFEELRQLVLQGLLYSSDDYAAFAPQLGEAPVKAMCLHVAHDCNLRCRYCFASTGDFGKQREIMDFPTAQKAIDLLVSLSGPRRNLEVDFFGGEPLMNFDVVKQTVEYARSIEKNAGKNFRFTITTNGLALSDDKIEYINREMSNVVLSLDGRKAINDAMRPLVNGEGSYERILPKFQKLVAGRGEKEYYVRGTYTRHNLDFDKDVLHLAAQGFGQISVEPVVGPAEDAYSIREEDMEQIAQSYDRLLDIMLKSPGGNETPAFHFFHFLLDLDNGPCAIKRLKGCGCGNEYLAVTPDGELYPCHQFVGQADYRMGDVNTGITRPELHKQFAAAHLLNKPECGQCWAKFYCSGGCNANNHSFCQDILKPYEISCTLEKQRLECAIALQALKGEQ